MDTDELLKMSDAIISGHGTPRKTKRTTETIENGVDFRMSCYFSRMVMITDNGNDDHVTNVYCYGISPSIWSLHFCSTSEFKPGNKPLFSMQQNLQFHAHCDVTRFE